MDWLQIVANIAQVLGVLWVLFFGGKALVEVVKDISKHEPIRKISSSTITNVLLALILLALLSLRIFPNPSPIPIPTPTSTSTTNGVTPSPSNETPRATITATTPQLLYSQITSGNPALDDPMNVQDSIALSETTTKGVGGCSFVAGAYHASVQVQGNVLWCPASNTNFKDFAYQVQMTVIKGDGGGIIFRFSNDATGNSLGYGFNIDQNGSYDLYRVSVKEGFTHLHSGSSLFIKTGLNQTNLIAVVARGSNIYLYLNRQYVIGVSDSTFNSGEIGVQAGEASLPTEVVFQNAQVWEI